MLYRTAPPSLYSLSVLYHVVSRIQCMQETIKHCFWDSFQEPNLQLLHVVRSMVIVTNLLKSEI